jgi:hypothetical protein
VGSRRIGIPAVLIALAAAFAYPAAGSGQVLYRTSARLSRLTVSGGGMGWVQQVSGSPCVRIFRRPQLGGTPTTVTRCRPLSQPFFTTLRMWVRLDGPHVFWEEAGHGNTEADEFVYSTLPGGRRAPAVYTINCGGPGKVAGPIAPGAELLAVSGRNLLVTGAWHRGAVPGTCGAR